MVNLKKKDFQDPYIDQSSGCLRNLWNINEPELLSIVDSAFAVKRSYDLEEGSYDLIRAYQLEAAENLDIPDYDDGRRFDFQYLKDLHRHLFQDVYEWAGQTREVNLSRGETHFLSPSLIEQKAQSTFSKLKQENYLKGLDANAFSEKAGYYLGEINRIHPFRDGNWRAQLEFINQLAHYSGHLIQWNMAQNMSHKHVIEASVEADKGKLNRMASTIRENLVSRDHVLDSGGRTFRLTDKIFYPKAGQKHNGPIIGSTERYVMQQLEGLPDQIILHNRDSLSGSIKPDINKIVEISYPHSSIGIVRNPEILKEKDSPKIHGIEKNSRQHEDHEWER